MTQVTRKKTPKRKSSLVKAKVKKDSTKHNHSQTNPQTDDLASASVLDASAYSRKSLAPLGGTSVAKSDVLSKRSRGRPRKGSLAHKDSLDGTPPTFSSLVVKFMPLVEALTHGLMGHIPTHIDRNDLISEGYIGLIEAAKRFDPKKGVKFETFARTRIQGAMFDWLRSLDLLPRSARDKLKTIEAVEARLSKELGRPANEDEIAEQLGVSLEEHQKNMARLNYKFIPIDAKQTNSWSGVEFHFSDLKDESCLDPVEQIYANKFWYKVKMCLEALPEREKLILSLMSIESLNLKEIGAVLDYSPSTVRQMRERAMIGLKEQVRQLKSAG